MALTEFSVALGRHPDLAAFGGDQQQFFIPWLTGMDAVVDHLQDAFTVWTFLVEQNGIVEVGDKIISNFVNIACHIGPVQLPAFHIHIPDADAPQFTHAFQQGLLLVEILLVLFTFQLIADPAGDQFDQLQIVLIERAAARVMAEKADGGRLLGAGAHHHADIALRRGVGEKRMIVAVTGLRLMKGNRLV